MKYLKRFNESLNQDWDLEEIKDIFQDFLDEGFVLDDVSVGSSLVVLRSYQACVKVIRLEY